MALFGLFEKKKAEDAKCTTDNNFKPLDLNTESVTNIYLECRPKNETKQVYKVIFKPKLLGWPEDSKPLLFDAEAIDRNLPNIFYLFGQLENTHRQYTFLPIKDILKKYDGTYWTKDKLAPMYLLHLGIAAGVIMAPDAKTQSAFMGSGILPTFSPNDQSEFDEWIKDYEPILARKRDV